MKRFVGLLMLAAMITACATEQPHSETKSIPTSWIDSDTGHRVVRLSQEAGSRSLYFHQNAYTAEGDKMVISVSNPNGVGVVDLKDMSVTRLYEHPDVGILFVGKKSRSVYLTQIASDKGQRVYPQNELQQPTVLLRVKLDTGKVTQLGTIAAGKIHSINSDETLLAGAVAQREHNLEAGPRDSRFEARYEARGPNGEALTFAEAKEVKINERLEARIPMKMFTFNIKTGEQHTILEATDWLNHIQFSPTDPKQLMYCHEGPWHKVDRVWTMRIDGSEQTKVHTRTMNMEIAGHEFFDATGEEIFYDLQTPRGEVFWLASYNMKTQQRVWRHMPRDFWSVHFNISPDGLLFAGDGGDHEMVARATNGKWIYLFESEPINDVAGISAPNAADLIKPAVLNGTRLVNMQDHDYRLEPNVTFTPDGKWVVFRSNMHGPVHVYAVEVQAAQSASGRKSVTY